MKSIVTGDVVYFPRLLINSTPVRSERARSIAVSGVQWMARSWSDRLRAGRGCHWLSRISIILPGSSSFLRSVRQKISSGHPANGVIVLLAGSME